MQHLVSGIPAGLLHRLYLAKDRPNYMNYGSLGTAVAHEISHILSKAQYPSGYESTLKDSWPSLTIKHYNQHAKCLSNQYASLYVPGVDEQVLRVFYCTMS